MIKTLNKETKEKMDLAIEALRHEFGTIRTGRASASILDSIKVEYYNSLTHLNQMATISVPEPRSDLSIAFSILARVDGSQG